MSDDFGKWVKAQRRTGLMRKTGISLIFFATLIAWAMGYATIMWSPEQLLLYNDAQREAAWIVVVGFLLGATLYLVGGGGMEPK